MAISSELLHSNHSLRTRANNHREQAPHFILFQETPILVNEHLLSSSISLYLGHPVHKNYEQEVSYCDNFLTKLKDFNVIDQCSR